MKHEQKIAAVVVTYFPDDSVLGNLDFIAGYVDFLIVVDNTPGISYRLKKHTIGNAKYIFNENNLGLASALNKGVKIAGLLGADYVFLFDQDTTPNSDFFKSMVKFMTKIDLKHSNCAFCVPNFLDRFTQTYATFPIIKPFLFRHRKCPDISKARDDGAIIAITSGTLISINKYYAIGPFRDEYFIDFIDNEYCLRAKSHNYFVAVNCNALINHSIGHRMVKKFLGITFKPNNHPAIRRYYIARNGILTAIAYFNQFPSYLVLIGIRLAHEFLSIVLFEKDKKSKIRAMLYGFSQGILGRMGPALESSASGSQYKDF